MTNQICKMITASVFSLLLTTQVTHASKSALREEMSYLFSRPRIETQPTNPKIFRNNQDDESKILETAISHLVRHEKGQAIEGFKDAIETNGSPLGYLYLAALWNDERYHSIVFNAIDLGVVSRKTVFLHAFFLKDQGYSFNLHSRNIED